MTTSRREDRKRRAFSLIETLVVILALCMLLMIGTVDLVGALKVQDSATAIHQRVAQRNGLADQFRTDVAEATAAPDKVDDLKASPTCLILRMPDASHLAYQWSNDRLERMKLTPSGTTRRDVPVSRSTSAVEFSHQGKDGRLISLQLSETHALTKHKHQSLITATLGGDTQ